MPKQNRKRKHRDVVAEIEYEIEAPRNKFRPLDEQTQAEDEQLNKILFGGTTNFLRSLEEAEREPIPSSSSSSSSTPNIDSGVGEDDTSDSEASYERQPAWYDDEDDGIEVGQALDAQGRKLPSGGINDRSNKYMNVLTHKFTSIVGTPKWASLDRRKMDCDSDDEILQTCGFVAANQPTHLPGNLLEYKKLKNLNNETSNEGIINSLEFHSNSTVCLVAGNSGIASLYAVDGKNNEKLHSVAFERFPIYCAKFIRNGNEALLGSNHSHIFSYDLIAATTLRIKLPSGLTQCKKFVVSPDSNSIAVVGKWGEVHMMDAVTKERIATLKQDSEVTALSYDSDGKYLYGHGENGEVTIWDVNMRRVRHRFMDEGCLKGTTLTVAPSNQFLATGSAQGIVNLYDTNDIWNTVSPKPRKTIMNLTTEVTSLRFNPSSEILALASVDITNAVKLYHVGSGSVYSNFPSFGSHLGNASVLEFSPRSGYLAMGNKKSTVMLYRLKYFKNY